MLIIQRKKKLGKRNIAECITLYFNKFSIIYNLYNHHLVTHVYYIYKGEKVYLFFFT